MAAIETRTLTRRYAGRRGIEGVTLSVPEGSLFGFLGPNGAGKTTSIRVLLGFLRPTSGTASVCGLDCWRESAAVKRLVGYVPGDLRLYPWLTGKSALRLVGAARAMDVLRAGADLAAMFDLDLSVAVRKMSRGMRQKLGLIMALAPEPRVLVMDEPTSALDPIMQDRLREHLRALAGRGHTVFFSSHTLGEVEALCDRVAIVREGRIVADTTLDAIRQQAGRVVVIRWRDGAVLSAGEPSLLRLTHRDDRTWSGTHEGPIEPLLTWLAQLPVEDVSITPPDLETLFRRFYQDPAS